jgi:ribonucleoside-diphosphate reductase alpha chain
MQRVVNQAEWTLVDPYEVRTKLGIELAETWGEEFEAAYQTIEANLDTKIKLYKRVNARELFKTVMRSQLETGMPYLWFKDTSNRANPNSHEGYIPGGNLCVAPETRILTDGGQFPIAELEGEWVNVWNGSEWSNVQVRKTGENQPLLKVHFSNGEHLECTYYHHFWIQDPYKSQPRRVEAKDLQPGDKLIKYRLPLVQSPEDIDFPMPTLPGSSAAMAVILRKDSRNWICTERKKSYLIESLSVINGGEVDGGRKNLNSLPFTTTKNKIA